jgi:hypothetical protein
MLWEDGNEITRKLLEINIGSRFTDKEVESNLGMSLVYLL